MRGLVGALGSCLLLAPLLTGCWGKDEYACPAGQVCIRVGNVADPGSLDPAKAVIKMDQTVIDDLLLGLTTFDADGLAIPGLASDWSVSDDKRTWTFHLRPAVWSDGEPITASDIVFSFRRLVDPATAAPYSGLLSPIENATEITLGKLPADRIGVRAPDPSTVEIRLRQPAPYLPGLLAHYGLLPVPEHAVRRWGDAWATPEHYVSSGPFNLVSWRLGDRIVLERNPRFYDAGAVCLDRVEYYPITDAIVAEHRIKTGGLDINDSFASDRLKYLRGAAGMADYVHVFPWADLIYVVFRTTEPALRDPRVRQALSMAIDRPFLAEKLLGSGQQPITNIVPPTLDASDPVRPPWENEPFQARQMQARQLLTAAGYTPEHPLPLTLKSSFSFGNVPVPIAADWRDVGVQVTLRREDTTVFFSDLSLGAYEVALTDAIADFPDPTSILDLLRGDEGENYAGYDDPTYDAMLQRGEDELDPAARERLLRGAEERILQDAPIAPVYTNPSHNLVSPRVTGWRDNSNDVHPMRWVCFADHAKAGSNSAAR